MKIEIGKFYGSSSNPLCVYLVTADNGQTVCADAYGLFNTAYWNRGQKITDFNHIEKKLLKELTNEQNKTISRWIQQD